jgi:hypothetical protein
METGKQISYASTGRMQEPRKGKTKGQDERSRRKGKNTKAPEPKAALAQAGWTALIDSFS